MKEEFRRNSLNIEGLFLDRLKAFLLASSLVSGYERGNFMTSQG